MKILLISPLGFPINSKARYVGIERLVWEYARELTKEHQVTVMAHAESEFPEGVELLPTKPHYNDKYILDELQQYQSYQYLLRGFDVIHDFSHQHLVARYNPKLPCLNLFWHAPSTAKYPKAPYNIIALSEWAKREFKRIYKQDARYQQSVVIDADKYRPSLNGRNNRLLAVARAGPDKGNLEAMALAKKLNLGIDVISARGTESQDAPLTDYEEQMAKLADGEQIKLFPNSLPESEKIKYMQTNMALIYITSAPEVTSHKIQECLFCGMSVIVPGIGAIPEIVTNGVDGFLCRNTADYVMAINNVNKLNPDKTREQLVERFAVPNVIKNYIPLYEEVANGAIWK